ncbi:hypothetical protein EK21DRAFT_118227 [Setomelanomma holmii]|uniref:Uncharacterized protein n=1 Tax=Setomelanomma holmii TaxID=210430 RepID=A0A9P4LHA6_9PLEO|nr:hypothetical protein EK21DRAFT_118227 [Setomelanomma holmii]
MVGYLKDGEAAAHYQKQTSALVTQETEKPMEKWSRNLKKRSNRNFSIMIPGGEMQLSFPKPASCMLRPQCFEEVGFTFIFKHSHMATKLHTRFFREVPQAPSSQLYAQLNVFTEAKICTLEKYFFLFESGSVEDISVALREGSISPYHIDEAGRNMCLSIAALYGRLDILNYLETQGIGQFALNDDSSIFLGFLNCSETERGDRAADPPSFIAKWTLAILVNEHYMAHDPSATQVLTTAFETIRKYGHNIPT